MVRRRVPADLRTRFGHEFKASMGTADLVVARVKRDLWWTERDREIHLARQVARLEASDIPNVACVHQALQRWCEHAIRGKPAATAVCLTDELASLNLGGRVAWDLSDEIIARARRVYHLRPNASRDVGLPLETAVLIQHLRAVAYDPQAWKKIVGFDVHLDKALVEAGLRAPVPPQVRHDVRSQFAAAWLKLVQHQELERRCAALVLTLNNVLQTDASSIVPPMELAGPSIAVEGKTVGDVIRAVQVDKARGKQDAAGKAFVRKNYEHVFRALEELVGEDAPLRSLDRDDIRRLRSLFERLPANATKIYPGVALQEVVTRAREDGRPPMTHNSARSYLVNLSALFSYALREGWIEVNPCKGMVPPRRDSVRRRGFTTEELKSIFSHLEAERHSDRWWILAILAFSGARASEVCQLHVDDLKDERGIPFLDFSCFDMDGRRTTSKSLKTGSSERVAPLHPKLVSGGLLQLAQARRLRGETRLFPSIRHHPQGGCSHDLSKWFGRFLDRIGMSQPGLVLHSFRHGFREAGRRVALSEEIMDALGGWAPRSAGAKYGDRHAIAANAAHMAKIAFGDFHLQE